MSPCAAWLSPLSPPLTLDGCALVTMWDFYQFVYYISFPRNASVALFLSCALISHLANKQNWENIVHNKGGLVSEIYQCVENPPEAKFLGFKHTRKMADF